MLPYLHHEVPFSNSLHRSSDISLIAPGLYLMLIEQFYLLEVTELSVEEMRLEIDSKDFDRALEILVNKRVIKVTDGKIFISGVSARVTEILTRRAADSDRKKRKKYPEAEYVELIKIFKEWESLYHSDKMRERSETMSTMFISLCQDKKLTVANLRNLFKWMQENNNKIKRRNLVDFIKDGFGANSCEELSRKLIRPSSSESTVEPDKDLNDFSDLENHDFSDLENYIDEVEQEKRRLLRTI